MLRVNQRFPSRQNLYEKLYQDGNGFSGINKDSFSTVVARFVTKLNADSVLRLSIEDRQKSKLKDVRMQLKLIFEVEAKQGSDAEDYHQHYDKLNQLARNTEQSL